MNKIIYTIVGIFCLMGCLTSCEKDLPLYDTPDNRLYFDIYGVTGDTLVNYSFYYNTGIQKDTVWIKLHTIGFASDANRPFELEQVLTGENDAQAGVQYVAFDNPEVQKYYYIPAGQATARVPVIVLRDASLKQKQYMLKFKIKPNREFIEGFQGKRTMYITISDFLSKPSGWGYYCNYLFGEYGIAKHQFMIEATGKKWDSAYLNEIHVESNMGDRDSGLMNYLNGFLRNALSEYNAERQAQGLGNLTESDGTVVSFPNSRL